MLYLLFCCFASALGGLLFGYDLFVISYPSLKRANEKSPGNSGRAGFGFSNEANDGGVINQRLASPVLTNLTEDAVLDRIPLRWAGGVVADRHNQSKAVSKLFLERAFPEPISGTVAAATIRKDQQLGGLLVTTSPLPAPPLHDGVDRKV